MPIELLSLAPDAPVTVDWLGNHPAHVDTLADWHVRAFAQWVNGWQIEQAAAELRTHTARRHFPTTLVALSDGELLGSVSLLADDPPAPRQYAPWLASLYVRPEARRRGVGALLVRAAVDEAIRLGIPELHLWTPAHAAFYRALGWHSLGKQRFGGVPATLMRIDCAVRSAAG